MEDISPWFEALFRWIHVVAGVLWIGLLYFFNWVNGNVAKQLDGPTKQRVLPELLPRTLYFFRWGAAYTWITGVLLLGMVYYMNAEGTGMGAEANMGIAFGIVLVGAAVYDALWKAMQDKKQLALIVSFVALLGLMSLMDNKLDMGPRAVFIHVGALFGTCMAMNVWMRIWPAQRKIITAIKAGTPPEPGWGALAGLRSKHNTYMSVPLIYIMLSSHHTQGLYFTVGENEVGWLFLAGLIIVSWVVVYWIYQKAAKPEVAAY